jgi:Family of unknown function (DUF6283)
MTALRPVDGPPCKDCPFRCDLPPGSWPDAVYRRLPIYDGNVSQQATAGANACMFCFSQPARLCGGWVAVFPLDSNLALRLQAAEGNVDQQSVRAYRTEVPLFGSGAEAAQHGLRESSNHMRWADRAAQCNCGHRRFSHRNAGGVCILCGCSDFQLDAPQPFKHDALVDDIVKAVETWAGGDPAKLGEAARILAVSPLLGSLPDTSGSMCILWRCGRCGECPVYRYDAAKHSCRCGHGIGDHHITSPAETRKTYVKQPA